MRALYAAHDLEMACLESMPPDRPGKRVVRAQAADEPLKDYRG